MKVLLCVAALFCVFSASVEGHGYLLTPPARGTAWRAGFNTPTDSNDMANFCGGRGVQHSAANGGKCAVCGEEYSKSMKRLEPGPANKYATGTIVGNYRQGEIVDITIMITAFHQGYYEFRLCDNNVPQKGKDSSIAVTVECLNKNLLRSAETGGSTFVASMGKSTHQVQLPPDVSCTNCVLQWRYRTANNWGCENNQCGSGMGPQEEFVGCADIAISPSNGQEIVPKTTTSKPAPTQKATEKVDEMSTPKVEKATTRKMNEWPTLKVEIQPKPEIEQTTTRKMEKVTTQKATTQKAMSETTQKATTRKAMPETTQKATTQKAIPETTQKATTRKAMPETTQKATTQKAIPETTQKATTRKAMPETTQKAAVVTTPKVIMVTTPKAAVQKPVRPKDGRKICKGLGALAHSMTTYCNLNCNHIPPYCPSSHCLCS